MATRFVLLAASLALASCAARHAPEAAPPLSATVAAWLRAPQDGDGDGVPDARDRCPDAPEDHDEFADDDGCLEGDNDGDGIGDIVDDCASSAEDHDGFEDGDGCPDPDNDRDRIVDAGDACPNMPEVFNGVDDGDGCPDEDVRMDQGGCTSDSGGLPLRATISFEEGAAAWADHAG